MIKASSPPPAREQGHGGWLNISSVQCSFDRLIGAPAGHDDGAAPCEPGVFEYRHKRRMPLPTATPHSATSTPAVPNFRARLKRNGSTGYPHLSIGSGGHRPYPVAGKKSPARLSPSAAPAFPPKPPR